MPIKKFNLLVNLIVLINLLFFSSFALAQNSRSFTSLDQRTVLSRLFESTKFNSDKEVLWKPNYSESIMMRVSDDGYCHTTLDTIMYFSAMNNKYATIIFSTYQYSGGTRESCHACSPTLGIAIFVNTKGTNWVIAQFEKDFTRCGEWGKNDAYFSIVKMGRDIFCLNIKTGIGGGQGYESGSSSYFSLDEYSKFKNVFSYIYLDSSVGAKGDKLGRVIEKSIKLLRTEDDHYTIELSSKNSHSKLMTKSKYKYSYGLGTYDLVQ